MIEILIKSKNEAFYVINGEVVSNESNKRRIL
jgi:hypothetical protein